MRAERIIPADNMLGLFEIEQVFNAHISFQLPEFAVHVSAQEEISRTVAFRRMIACRNFCNTNVFCSEIEIPFIVIRRISEIQESPVLWCQWFFLNLAY